MSEIKIGAKKVKSSIVKNGSHIGEILRDKNINNGSLTLIIYPSKAHSLGFTYVDLRKIIRQMEEFDA